MWRRTAFLWCCEYCVRPVLLIAEPLDNCTKYYACVWFTDGSCMFYNYIYAKDRAQAFYKALNHFADNVIAERFGSAKDTLNYVSSVSISEIDWED